LKYFLLLLLLSGALQGCGTITSFAAGPDEVPISAWPLYGGIRTIVLDPGKVYGSDYWMFGPVAWAIIAVDATLSFACDTVLLPVTLPWALLR
jgi:uncharacterized protein YceK